MAALKVRFTRHARQDFDGILGFIAQADPEGAAKLSLRIEELIDRMAALPESGRKIPEAPEHSAREWVVVPLLRIFYRVDEQAGTLWILRAMRAERQFQAEQLDPLEP